MQTTDEIARPWGSEQLLAAGAGVLVKLVTIEPGRATPLQCRRRRVELWNVLTGGGLFHCGLFRGAFDRKVLMMQDSFLVTMGMFHQVVVPRLARRPLVLLQVWYGEQLELEDTELAPPGFMEPA